MRHTTLMPSRKMQGKTVLVTGCTHGIGKETAAALAGKGATVIMGCRNLELAEQVADEIRSLHPGASVIVGPKLDLCSQDSIRKFAENYLENGWDLSVLINNAGAYHEGEPWYTPEGVGGLCQVNHLGPFTLTRLLEGQLVKNAPSRVVCVSSVTHRLGRVGDPATFLTDWNQGSRYANTKLANALFAFELQRRLGGAGVQVCAVDPGAVKSSIWNGSLFAKPPLKWMMDAVYAPNQDGAAAVVHAASVAWEADAAAAASATDTGMAAAASRGISTTSTSGDLSNSSDLRFYARGMFSWPTVSSPWGSAPSKPLKRKKNVLEKVRASAYAVSLLGHSVTDWPVRWVSGFRIASSTSPVPAAPLTYDAGLAAALWEVSSDAAGLRPEPL